MWLTDVLLIVFGQEWPPTTQRKKINWAAIHTQYLVVHKFAVAFYAFM